MHPVHVVRTTTEEVSVEAIALFVRAIERRGARQLDGRRLDGWRRREAETKPEIRRRRDAVIGGRPEAQCWSMLSGRHRLLHRGRRVEECGGFDGALWGRLLVAQVDGRRVLVVALRVRGKLDELSGALGRRLNRSGARARGEPSR
jgi:hypothetical protein